MLAKEPKRTTYLGVSKRCDACHFDEHRGELSRECQKCHTETRLEADAGAFNHQTTAFPLLGKHKDVACAKCHPSIDDEHFDPNASSRSPGPRRSWR